ncbi:MAG: hypothetical protein ABIL39_11190 [candidate division WOR-3 bacterium]
MNKIIICLMLIFASIYGGRLGIGFGLNTRYQEDYLPQNYRNLMENFFWGEFRISAEGLPYMFIEPVGMIFHDAVKNHFLPGVGLRINIAPRIGKFFLGPFFGFEGDILFYNPRSEFRDAFYANKLQDYFENSHPRGMGSGYGGLSLYLGKSTSLDCHYRYLYLAPGMGIEMVGINLTFYLNW